MGKLFLLLAVLGVGIFYGISLSKDGIEQIHGPLAYTEAEPEPENHVTAEAMAEPHSTTKVATPGAESSYKSGSDSLIMRLLNKLGGLIRLLADGIIRILVSLGEAVLS